jgi:hypothetical protein
MNVRVGPTVRRTFDEVDSVLHIVLREAVEFECGCGEHDNNKGLYVLKVSFVPLHDCVGDTARLTNF